jgi:hypothetical protein
LLGLGLLLAIGLIAVSFVSEHRRELRVRSAAILDAASKIVRARGVPRADDASGGQSELTGRRQMRVQLLGLWEELERRHSLDDGTIAAWKRGDPLLDAWGRALMYRCPGPVHAHGWDLWSCGPNRIDEHGGGDDILVGEDLPADFRERKATRETIEWVEETVRALEEWSHTRPSYRGVDLRFFCRNRGEGLETLPRLPEEVPGRGETVLLDAWGHAIKFRFPGRVHRHGWDLYSVGPNGIDEQGGGDDILVGEDVADVGSAK